MSEFYPGGLVQGPQDLGTIPVKLAEGERIVDRRGYIRGQVFRGRLLWFPLWFSARLPRIQDR